MNALEEKFLHVTRQIERQVDAAIEKIDNLDASDLETLRKQRFDQLKKQEAQKTEWLANGHGQYDELPEEKCFFDVIKKSKKVVLHFYTASNVRCPIVDKHLKILAPKHVETRFVKLNAEKCPFLAQNLKIKTIPSLVVIVDSVMVDKIVGFTQLGNRDDFTTETMEWRLAQNDGIDYEGDLGNPPEEKSRRAAVVPGRKIRDGMFANDDIDLEEEGIIRDDLKSERLPVQSTELTAEELQELGLDD